MEAKKSKDSKNSFPEKTEYAKKLIQSMSWSYFAALAKNTNVLLVPYGSISKEHGHHLPLDTDYRQAMKLTERLALQLEQHKINYLVAPPLGYSYYPAFDLYPGSVHLDKETATKIIVPYCQAYAKAGCKKFYIVNTGISTIAILKDAQARLSQEGIEMVFFNYKEFNAHLPPELIKMEQGTHAGALETSLMLALDPDCVDMSKAEDNDVPDQEGFLYPSWNPPPPNPEAPGIVSDSGVWGAATKATKEIGEKIITAFGPYALSEVQALISKPSFAAELSTSANVVKVGMREFRAHLPQYLLSPSPVAITRHGETMGFYIPTRHQPEQEDILMHRAKRGNREKFLKVLNSAPDVEPDEKDKL